MAVKVDDGDNMRTEGGKSHRSCTWTQSRNIRSNQTEENSESHNRASTVAPSTQIQTVRLPTGAAWLRVQAQVLLGVLLVPQPPFLRHLLVQVPLLPFFSGHSFIVGRQSKDGP